MRSINGEFAALLFVAICICAAPTAYAQTTQPSRGVSPYSTAFSKYEVPSPEGAIPVGTTITLLNWQKYKDFMPVGLQLLFTGTHGWRFPANFRLEIGPTHRYPLPKPYVDNTEKYSSQVRIVTLPDGRRSLKGYVAGVPFPNPQAPLKGWKILVDEWYRSEPAIQCDNHLHNYIMDRFGHISTNAGIFVYRRLGHLSAMSYPINNPQTPGIDQSEYNEMRAPEQIKYTTNLQFIYYDPLKPEDVFLFIPALRRSLRLSVAARCSPFIGTDLTQDDTNNGWNGGISNFDANFLRKGETITITASTPELFGNLNNYYHYPSAIFPTLNVGKWEVRNCYIIDVRKMRSQGAQYCYGKQIMYIDPYTYDIFWKDIYDANMKFWKLAIIANMAAPAPHEGLQESTGNFWIPFIDFQNRHMSSSMSAGPRGGRTGVNQDCNSYEGSNYSDITRYASTQGLAMIMQ